VPPDLTLLFFQGHSYFTGKNLGKFIEAKTLFQRKETGLIQAA
jgi:hypothetical protein